jgi:hypothetical protein
MSDSKTAKAAAKAVARSQQTTKEERTPQRRIEDVIKGVRSHRFVPPLELLFFVEQFEAYATALVTLLNRALKAETKVADLIAKNEEFRAVYEQENRTASLKVERVLDDEVKVSAVAETPVSYILFDKQPRQPNRKTDWWIIRASRDNSPLGRVFFFLQWRKFAFEGITGYVFDADCLQEITDFVKEQNEKRKRGYGIAPIL